MLRRCLLTRFRHRIVGTALIATLAATAVLPNPAVGQGSPPAAQAPAAQAPAAQAPAAQAPAAKQPTAAPTPANNPPAPANGQAAPAAKPAAPKAPTSEALQTLRDRLDTIKADLEAREKAITGPNVGAGDLTRARDGLDPLADRLRSIIDLLGPRLEAAPRASGPDRPEAEGRRRERGGRPRARGARAGRQRHRRHPALGEVAAGAERSDRRSDLEPPPRRLHTRPFRAQLIAADPRSLDEGRRRHPAGHQLAEKRLRRHRLPVPPKRQPVEPAGPRTRPRPVCRSVFRTPQHRSGPGAPGTSMSPIPRGAPSSSVLGACSFSGPCRPWREAMPSTTPSM
jgi:hypothetical protein